MYKVLQRIKKIFIIILYNLFCLFKINSKKVLIYSPSNDYLSLNLSIIKNNIKNSLPQRSKIILVSLLKKNNKKIKNRLYLNNCHSHHIYKKELYKN